jgi:isopentenyl diphosphate isomerase/L-lactate dehydrogenase-like FMN-dependent dehydrogenase
VFKALALGAAAVSAGRALMGPLAEAGAEGVRDKMLEITAGLAGTMARTASRNIGSIDASVIRSRAY